MTQGTLNIHSENILPIIKKWLYSDKDIFLRELVSNACDALSKLKILRDRGETEAKDEEFSIDITIDKEAKTLTISDTGIGMTAEEVRTYIAQIAFSGAEEFVEKYQNNDEKDQFIGHFGLGFYSSYMVANQVDIQTLSYKKDASPVFWSCDGSSEYTIDAGDRTNRGTSIVLHIEEESAEFLDPHKIRSILKQYCSFLPYPIRLNGDLINEKEPLWIKNPSECKEEDYLAFYRYLYPMQEDPLFWVHLNVDYPFNLKGILYFPKLKRHFDLNKQTVQLYCNRVFVSENCKDVLPEYLMPMHGVIDSPDIPLNVSRSYLQLDRTVRKLGSHVAKKVCDSLRTLYKTDRSRYINSWEDTSVVVKLGAVEDEKFYDRAKDLLIWKTTNEEEWLTANDYLEQYGEKTGQTVLYTADPDHHTHLLEAYKSKNITVLIANTPLDTYTLHAIERHISPAKFKRIDAEVDDVLLDKEREKTVLDEQGKTESGRLADFFRTHLQTDGLEVVAKSLTKDDLPGLIIMDEQQRRLRDSMRSVDGAGLANIGTRTFVVNTNSPLMTSIYQLKDKDPTLAKELAEEMYDLALLSQKEMDNQSLGPFIQRTSGVLEKLAKAAADKS